MNCESFFWREPVEARSLLVVAAGEGLRRARIAASRAESTRVRLFGLAARAIYVGQAGSGSAVRLRGAGERRWDCAQPLDADLHVRWRDKGKPGFLPHCTDWVARFESQARRRALAMAAKPALRRRNEVGSGMGLAAS